jgi:hypothetical protein
VASSAEQPSVVSTPLDRLAEAVLARTDAIVDRAAQRMQEQLPSYATLPRAELLPVLAENMRNIVTAVRDPDAAPRLDDAHYRESGEVRAGQGVPSDDMLHAWRIGLDVVREEARAIAPDLELDDGVLLEFVEATLRLSDIGMLATAKAHRDAELELV